MSRAAAPAVGGIGRLDSAALCGPLLVLMTFVIASGNARWLLWSGLFPSLIIPPWLIVLSLRDPATRLRVPAQALALFAVLSALAILAGASALLVDPSYVSIVQWLASYVSPLLIYLACLAVPFNWRLAGALWIALTLGTLIPLLAGLVAYLSEWGIPNAVEVLTSRYNLLRMAGYMDATFGNTSNTAALLALLAPAWLAVSASRGLGARLRWLCAVALFVAVLHALIVESRTAFIVLAMMLLPVALYHRRPIMGAVGLALSYALYKLLPILAEAQTILTTAASALSGGRGVNFDETDYSVDERFEAMSIGVRLMLDNPTLGIGPGNSPKWNMYTSAHQYWINQGEEIGVLGFALSLALCLLVTWRLGSMLLSRRRGSLADPVANLRFAGLAGASGYLLYGSIANMPTASTAVNVWIGLFALMLGLADARFTDAPRASAPLTSSGS